MCILFPLKFFISQENKMRSKIPTKPKNVPELFSSSNELNKLYRHTRLNSSIKMFALKMMHMKNGVTQIHCVFWPTDKHSVAHSIRRWFCFWFYDDFVKQKHKKKTFMHTIYNEIFLEHPQTNLKLGFPLFCTRPKRVIMMHTNTLRFFVFIFKIA